MTHDSSVLKTPLLRFLAFSTVAIIVAHLLDGWMFHHFRLDDIYDHDWGRFLRVLGFAPLWLAGGIALALHDQDRGRRVWRGRGALLTLGAFGGGLAAELLKLFFRRLRPGDLGIYSFRPLTERTFSSSGLALPSSHAMVAFGAAAMLSRLFPRARWVWWSLAWGCGLSRVAAGAHFFSDVVVAALFAWLAVAYLFRLRDPAIT